MSEYLKISNIPAGSHNKGLRNAIIYIGTYYMNNKNKENKNPNYYFKKGIQFLKRIFGVRKNVIKFMVYPKKTSNKRKYEWNYHRLHYSNIYREIVKRLHKKLHLDKNLIIILNDLYQEMCENVIEGNNLERTYSNSLVYWQKSMLRLNRSDGKTESDRDKSKEIFDDIMSVDISYKFP